MKITRIPYTIRIKGSTIDIIKNLAKSEKVPVYEIIERSVDKYSEDIINNGVSRKTT